MSAGSLRAPRRLAVALGLSLASCAAPPPPQETMPKEALLEAMESSLPAAFCREGFYFLSCFQMSAEACTNTATSTVRACIETLADKVPADVDRSAAGAWGERIGSCAGHGFELAEIQSKVNSPKCEDPSAWVQTP